MILKPLPTPSDDLHQQPEYTHVFYASMPEPQLDVDGLSRQFDSGMDMNDLPPSYDAALENENDSSKVSAEAKGDSKRPPSPTPGDRFVPVYHANTDAAAVADRHVSFGRPIPESVTTRGNSSTTFDPLVLHSKSKKLEDGFFAVPPPTDLTPHPFVSRDVQETDWRQFLVEIRDAANANTQHSTARTTDGPGNLFQSLGTMLRSISSDRPAHGPGSASNYAQVGSVVDRWNDRFFKPRGLDVVLAKGSTRLSGDKRLPPPDSVPEENARVLDGAGMPSMPGMLPMGDQSQSQTSRDMGPQNHHHEHGHGHRHGDAHHHHHHHQQQQQQQRDKKDRRQSSSSSSSSSSSDSDSDSDPDPARTHAYPRDASASAPGPYVSDKALKRLARAERRAARHERRHGSHSERTERRFERKMARRARKVERWERRGLLPGAAVGGLLGVGAGSGGHGHAGPSSGFGFGGGRGMGMGMGMSRPGLGMGITGMGPMMAGGGHGHGMGMGRGGWGGRHGPPPFARMGMGMGMMARGGFGMSGSRAVGTRGPFQVEEDGYFRLIVCNINASSAAHQF